MSECQLDNIQSLQHGELASGVHLVVLDAMAIPPHILLVVAGKLYAISTGKPTVGVSVEKLIQVINRRKIPTLFVHLDLPLIVQQGVIDRVVSTIMTEFGKVRPGEITCLAPIKQFFNEVYQLDTSGVQFVFDLIPALNQMQSVKGSSHLHLDPHIQQDNSFGLMTYSMFEVNEGIYRAMKGKATA